MLLSREFGPWLFLSEIITSLDLEEDLPAEGDCGTCAHCQKVCPTGALDQDYKIDARLCIAYLTIEHKGVIPRELRPKIKDWVFGCDECLTICPFTSKSKDTKWLEFRPESGVGERLNLEELFDLDSNREHEEKFRGTALLRAGRKQMLRNACIVLGNSGQKEALPYLEKALADPSPLVRLHAAWGLGKIADDRGRFILQQKLKLEVDPEVCAEIEFALASF
jgi:epoxyqueuosine reductase